MAPPLEAEHMEPEPAKRELPRTPPPQLPLREISEPAAARGAPVPRRRTSDQHSRRCLPAESVSPPVPHAHALLERAAEPAPQDPQAPVEDAPAAFTEGGSTPSRQRKEAAATADAAGPDWPWDAEPVGESGSAVWDPAGAGAVAAPPGAEKQDDIDFLLAQLETLSERLLSLEEEKQCSEQELGSRIDKLVRTCERQSEVLAAQQQQMEAQDRRLQTQEQQLKLQEQRLQRQEKQLQQQGQRLEEQEAQLQQQDQQLEQQDQQLREHEQQMDQQDQQLEEHKAVLEELVATGQPGAMGTASSEEDPSPAQGSTGPQGGSSRQVLDAWGLESEAQIARGTPMPLPMVSGLDSAAAIASLAGSGGGLAGSSGDRPNLAFGSGLLHMSLDGLGFKCTSPKKAGVLWEKVTELCGEHRYLEAYKQAIAEPEESCLLRLMRHTGPIVDKLDAESNSRLIRRLIHILSSPSKDCAIASIEQIFSWLRQALTSGIHFTASQVEDLASALQRVAAPQSPLPAPARAEAAQLLTRVSALRRP